jgi:hypothetical protein
MACGGLANVCSPSAPPFGAGCVAVSGCSSGARASSIACARSVLVGKAVDGARGVRCGWGELDGGERRARWGRGIAGELSSSSTAPAQRMRGPAEAHRGTCTPGGHMHTLCAYCLQTLNCCALPADSQLPVRCLRTVNCLACAGDSQLLCAVCRQSTAWHALSADSQPAACVHNPSTAQQPMHARHALHADSHPQCAT